MNPKEVEGNNKEHKSMKLKTEKKEKSTKLKADFLKRSIKLISL